MVGVVSPVSEKLLAKLHPLEVKVLPHLKDGMTQSALAAASGMQDVEVSRALQWLENKLALNSSPLSSFEIVLDENGKKAVSRGMPEHRFLAAVKAGAASHDAIAKAAGLDTQEVGVSIGQLKKAGLIEVGKENAIALTKKGEEFDAAKDEAVKFLHKLSKGALAQEKLSKAEQEILGRLKSRKQYVILKEMKDRTITLTDLGKQLVKIDVSKLSFADNVTVEDLQSGAWKDKKYRSFDVTAPVPSLNAGKEHFVQEAIDYIKSIWIEMGFQEMEGDMVQSAFWNLDALFVPQDHPAREMQDTFYLDSPRRTTIPRPIFERVRDVHETGANTGSKGWRYRFSREESEQLLLRTQTTALSAQTLLAIKEGRKTMPGKYFVVSNVFRNEALDWKHLFEFHQVEGIVVDPHVTFAQLIGYLKIFFAKMGFHKILLRPSYFPFTEPSVEVAVWNEEKKQWIELGGAGVFRPEVTKALLGEEVPVLAWGLGLERIIVEYFGLKDLRDLYRNDVVQLRGMKRFVKIEKD